MKSLHNRRRLASGISVIAIATALTVANSALAQGGHFHLQGRAPAGTEVVATQADTGTLRQATVNADGTYAMPASGWQLPRHGRGRCTGCDGSGGVDSVVNFVSAGAEREISSSLRGARRSKLKTSQVNQFVTLHDIASLPQTTRNFLEFADTVPGMQFSVDKTQHHAPRRRQLNSAVNVFIDGVSQKDFVGTGDGKQRLRSVAAARRATAIRATPSRS